MMPFIRAAAASLALSFGLVLAIPLAARAYVEDEAMQPVWLHYLMAIDAAQYCWNMRFDGPAYDSMATVIDHRVDHAIGAGPRTHLVDVAKDQTWDLVFKYGCNDPRVADLLALFHNELQLALPPGP